MDSLRLPPLNFAARLSAPHLTLPLPSLTPAPPVSAAAFLSPQKASHPPTPAASHLHSPPPALHSPQLTSPALSPTPSISPPPPPAPHAPHRHLQQYRKQDWPSQAGAPAHPPPMHGKHALSLPPISALAAHDPVPASLGPLRPLVDAPHSPPASHLSLPPAPSASRPQSHPQSHPHPHLHSHSHSHPHPLPPSSPATSVSRIPGEGASSCDGGQSVPSATVYWPAGRVIGQRIAPPHASPHLHPHLDAHIQSRPHPYPRQIPLPQPVLRPLAPLRKTVRAGGQPRDVYVCPVAGCARVSAEHSNLKAHLRVHTGERPYVCRHASCGKSFRWKSSLSYHERALHALTAAGAEVAEGADVAAGTERRRRGGEKGAVGDSKEEAARVTERRTPCEGMDEFVGDGAGEGEEGGSGAMQNRHRKRQRMRQRMRVNERMHAALSAPLCGPMGFVATRPVHTDGQGAYVPR